MNEITRIHIAKVAYDIEVSAKKQLEKYIKSLETYTQDSEVLADIEIRMTELLAERNVAAGGVINTEDVAAIRKQLGEPYEFAEQDGDIAVGALRESEKRHRFYRSMDDAVLGGVLSGIAAYFKVDPLWTRLIFILVAFISFGLALPLYVVLWIIIPSARTAAEKLQMAGKAVTLESIRELNAFAEANPSRSIAPAIKRVSRIFLGYVSILAALITLGATIWGAILVAVHDGMTHVSMLTFGIDNQEYLGWIIFWIVIAGALLLTALFTLIAYALLANKLTKRIIISAVIVIALGLAAVGVVVAITTTQGNRVVSEAQAAVQTSKSNIPKEFSNVRNVVFTDSMLQSDPGIYYGMISSIQYVVDEGTPRYELSALSKAKVVLEIEGTTARVSLDIPRDPRNNYVRTSLIIYGPALEGIESNGAQVSYSNAEPQDSLTISLPKEYGQVTVKGAYKLLVASGKGTIDISDSAVQKLDVRSTQELQLLAGTVRELIVTQSEVCGGDAYSGNTSITVAGVASGLMTYNGKEVPAETRESACAIVIVGEYSENDSNRYDRNN